jgi:PhoPQ-activated pathogenicity-related protein
MTSQQWLSEKEVERPLWTHWITVVRPLNVTSDVGLLFIGGGSNERQPPARPAAWLVDAARETGTVTAELRLVPNQPVIFKTTLHGSRGRRTISSRIRGTSTCARATRNGRRACR